MQYLLTNYILTWAKYPSIRALHLVRLKSAPARASGSEEAKMKDHNLALLRVTAATLLSCCILAIVQVRSNEN